MTPYLASILDVNRVLPFLLDAAIKGSAVILIAAAAAWSLRNRSAATRHAVWTTAIAAQLLIPAMGLFVPQWRVGWIDNPAWWSPAPSRAGAQWSASMTNRAYELPAAPEEMRWETGVSSLSADDMVVPANVGLPAPARADDASREALDVSRTTHLVTALWLLGCLIVLGRLAIGTVIVARLAVRAQRVVDSRSLELMHRIALELRIRRPVTLLRAESVRVPLTWGIIYPVILLPAAAERWAAERLRAVFMHELAHVKRLDALTQVVAQFALAVFWFNPLVWHVSVRMRRERENACDNHVLTHGVRPSDYASDLLELVRSAGAGPSAEGAPAFAALAMARRSEFEGRMLSILDARLSRASLGRAGLAASMAAALVIVAPLAAFSPFPPPDQGGRTEAGFPAPSGDAYAGQEMPVPDLLPVSQGAQAVAGGSADAVDLENLPVWRFEETFRTDFSRGPDYGVSWIRPPAFSSPGHRTMVIGPDRHLYVADFGQVKVFDINGVLIRFIGTLGDGPGELRDVRAIGFFGDTLWTWELRGTSLFTMDGRFIERVPRRSVSVDIDGFVSAVRVTMDAPRMGGYDASYDLPDGPRTQGLVVPGFRFARDGRLDTVGKRVIGPRPAMLEISGMAVLPRAEFAGSDIVLRHTLQPGELRIDWPVTGWLHAVRVDNAGDTVTRTAFRYRPVEMPRVLADSIYDVLVTSAVEKTSAGRAIGSAGMRDSVRKYVNLPAHFPPITFMVQTSDGSVLLRRETGGDRWRWTVLTADLRPVAELQTSRHFDLHLVDGDRVWGATTDERGIPWLVGGVLRQSR